ncbi:hypothetical protein L873DRAFT_1787475 [Choiromyces venosus 120613-1]|uniref:Uncharacterized protein n=1 Tax=Choiromyces venosus 120613-1 TaxID=1336337 RepID=A0A3N4K2Z9_9PEZI|nr:hypothetical protein L873DRAFT_1787475 [Choiromyces venosus 120613-1]
MSSKKECRKLWQSLEEPELFVGPQQLSPAASAHICAPPIVTPIADAVNTLATAADAAATTTVAATATIVVTVSAPSPRQHDEDTKLPVTSYYPIEPAGSLLVNDVTLPVTTLTELLLDLGQMNVICEFCEVLYWLDEPITWSTTDRSSFKDPVNQEMLTFHNIALQPHIQNCYSGL